MSLSDSHFPYKKAIFVLAEALLLFSLSLLAAFIMISFLPGSYGPFEPVPFVLQSLFVATICQLCLYYFDLYDLNTLAGDLKELGVRLLQSLGVTSITLAGIGCLLPAFVPENGVFFLNVLFLLTLFPAWRGVCNWTLRSHKLAEKVLVLGSEELAKEIGREILRRKDCGYQLVGFADPDPARLGMSLVNPGVVATTDQLLQVVNELGIQRVVVALQDRRGNLPLKGLLNCKFQGIKVDEGLSFYERLTGKIAVERLRPSWLIFSDGFIRSRPVLLLKAVIDFSVSLISLALLSPLMLLVALLIRLDSPGPVFYKQERVGKDGRVFTLRKFRSMREDAEVEDNPVWAQDNDPRVTRMGRFLRKTRIDEVPQMFSVLKGEMSFVGPRPERPFFVERLAREIPYYDQRHVMKPGITGWAQINYHYGSSVEDALEKLRYDLYYIKHMSPLFDLSIIFRTVKVVLEGEGAR